MNARRWILPAVLALGLGNGLYRAGRETIDMARRQARGPDPWTSFMDACSARIPPEASVLISGGPSAHILAARLYPRPVRLVAPDALAAAASPGAWAVVYREPFDPATVRLGPAHDLR